MNNRYFDFLDELRESGKTNMFGAASYLMAEFKIDKKEATKILFRWFEFKKGNRNN